MPLEQLNWDGLSKSRPDENIYAAPDGNDWKEITRQLQATQQATTPKLTVISGQGMITGQPFYMAFGKIWLSQATDLSHADVCGFTLTNAAGNSPTQCTTKGQVSRDDWTPIAGTTNLAVGSCYYLHPTVAGMITDTPPSLPGQFVVHLGKAIDPNTLDIKIEQPVEL